VVEMVAENGRDNEDGGVSRWVGGAGVPRLNEEETEGEMDSACDIVYAACRPAGASGARREKESTALRSVVSAGGGGGGGGGSGGGSVTKNGSARRSWCSIRRLSWIAHCSSESPAAASADCSGSVALLASRVGGLRGWVCAGGSQWSQGVSAGCPSARSASSTDSPGSSARARWTTAEDGVATHFVGVGTALRRVRERASDCVTGTTRDVECGRATRAN
jgi:hypothetical protein